MGLFLSILVLCGIVGLEERVKKPMQFYLAGMITGWIAAVLSFAFFISRQYYYQNMMNFMDFFWKRISAVAFPAGAQDFFIGMLQLGLSLFLYCFFKYAMIGERKFGWKGNVLCMMPLLFEVILFSPFLYKMMDAMDMEGNLYLFMVYQGTYIFKTVNFTYLLAAIALTGYHYIVSPAIRILKFKYLYNLIVMILMFASFWVLFGWTPKVLIRPTRVYGFFLYNVPNIHQQIRFINYFAIISMLLLAIICFLRYHYNKLVVEDQSVEVHFRQSTKTAAMGMRVFTHSMKNELQAVMAETEFLEERFAGDEEALYSINLIRDSCKRAFKSIDMGNSVFKNRHFTLKKMAVSKPLHAALEDFKKNCGQIEIELEEGAEKTECYLDEASMQEVFKNLLVNSAEAIADSGRKDCGRIHVTIKTRGPWVMIRLEDNGKGIEDSQLEHVFEPFYSTKSSATNWGIGLLFCYNVITTHGGQISAVHKEGEGAVFEIYLPKA